MLIIILIIVLLIMLMVSTSQAIYDYHTGECMATMAGHSELVTGLAFSNNCRHLISVSGKLDHRGNFDHSDKMMVVPHILMSSGDSCVFVWRLPGEMVATMQVF